MSDIAPNDPNVMQDIVGALQVAINDFNAYTEAWRERVDGIIVRAQNAATSTTTPDGGGVTGQVPEAGPGSPASPSPVDTTTPASTDATGSSTGTTGNEFPTDTTGTDTTGSTPPEDTGTGSSATSSTGTVHDFNDPSGDDTISDPSHDDVPLS